MRSAGGERSSGDEGIHCLALLIVGLLPTLIGLTGSVYFFAALLLGLGYLGFGTHLAIAPSVTTTRRLLLASLVYLPAVLALMAVDKIPS